jgi:predicted amidohydrolase
MQKAHAHGARLVVFPELALTTFFPRYLYEDEARVLDFFEREMPNAAVQPLFDLAHRLGVAFYLGYAELAVEAGQERRYNTSILVDEHGQIVGRYRKVHLPGTVEPVPGAPYQHLEKRYFHVGDLGFPVWELFGVRTGMCICNDRRWPETFRVMALKGAELVLLGYNTPDSNIHHPEPVHLRMFHSDLAVQAAAYQNGCWVVTSAKAGREDGHGLIGGSSVVAPTGEIAARAVGEGDEIVVHEADLELGRYIRRTVFDFARHRRVEHYGIITR